MTASVVLDTHALLWWKGDPDRLSRPAADAIQEARRILICPITFWEVGMLVQRARIALDRSTAAWAADILAEPGTELASLDEQIAVTAAQLDALPGDPADRLIAATSLAVGAPMITKDRAFGALAAANSRFRIIW